MSEFNQRYHARLQREYAELNDPLVKAQLQLDHFWEAKLERRAAALRRIERPGAEDAESGIYDPVARYERETDDGWPR